MILVITEKSRNEKTGRVELVVSHGVDYNTGRNVVLPWVHPSEIKARFDTDLQEYVLD